MSTINQRSQELHHVGECLYRNGNGNYVALLKVKGKQIKKSLKTKDRQLANRRLAELREKSKRLHGTETRNIRFDDLAEGWLEYIRTDLKPASLRRRRVAINGLRPFFGGKPIRSIGYRDIEQWKKQRGGNISSRSHNIELETLSKLLKYGVDKGIILENSATKFKRRKQPHRVAMPPTRKELSILVRELRSSPKAVASGAADMVEFLAYSGLRVGEAREIRRQDINPESQKIRVTGGELGRKKHQEKYLPIFPNLAVVVHRILDAKPELHALSRIFRIESPRCAIELACKRTGLPRFNVHSLRHFFATNAIEAGASFKTVAEWLNNSDGGILVASTYGHLRPEFMEEAASKLTFQAIQEEEESKP